MTEFLSDGWFDSLEAMATQAEIDAGIHLVVQQTVEGESPISWQIRLERGTVVVARGVAADADVRLTSDRATALGIHRGEISAQRAFLDGKLRIGGDIAALMADRHALEAVAPMLGLT